MSWSDRDWDDWIRGQPHTFWGDEKRRLEETSSPDSIASGQPISVGAAGSSAGPERSIEEYLEGIILTVASFYMTYVVYQAVMNMDVESGVAMGLIFGAFLGTAVVGHLILATGPGQMLLRMLSYLLGLAVPALLVVGIVYLWSSV